MRQHGRRVWEEAMRERQRLVLQGRSRHCAAGQLNLKAVHAHTIPRRDLFVSAGLTITSILFALNEELQDILLEEIFCFTPMLSAPVLALFPDALLGGEGARAARRLPRHCVPADRAVRDRTLRHVPERPADAR